MSLNKFGLLLSMTALPRQPIASLWSSCQRDSFVLSLLRITLLISLLLTKKSIVTYLASSASMRRVIVLLIVATRVRTNSKLFWWYCKKDGHLIKNYRIRPSHFGQSTTPTTFTSYVNLVIGSSFFIPTDLMQQIIIKDFHVASFGKPKSTTPSIIYSSATHHMIGDMTSFTSFQPFFVPKTINIGNGINLDI